MLTHVWNFIHQVLGLGVPAKAMTVWQMVCRGIVIFVAGLIMVRFSDRRFFAKRNAFDLMLVFLLASMLSRAVNGSGALLGTLATAFIMVALHRLLGLLACRSSRFGNLIKGHPDILITEGKVAQEIMRHNHISQQDLIEDLRLNASLTDTSQVKVARLERNGEISVIRQTGPDKITLQPSSRVNHE